MSKIVFRMRTVVPRFPDSFESLYYGQRNPLPVFIVSARASLPLRVITLVCTDNIPKQANLSEEDNISCIFSEGEQECKILLNSVEHSEHSIFKGYESTLQKITFC